MRVAIAHDWFTTLGGAEKVAREICRMFPGATLVTAIADPRSVSELFGDEPIRIEPLWVDRLPGARKHHRRYLPAMMHAWSKARIDADVLISSSHACAHAIGRRFDGPHVVYCHTPMRYAWRFELEKGRMPAWARPVGKMAARYLRRWDAASAGQVDRYVANSANIAARIHECYGQEATVVHPPVEVERFARTERRLGEYLLAIGRLVPYKRFDLAVAACTALGAPLVVAGSGPEEARLREMAGPTVRFVGQVPERDLPELYARAEALVFPGEEDFGIVPVEAQAAGVPVVAFGVGGARETVRDAETGMLFSDQSVEDIISAVLRLRSSHLDTDRIRAWAATFGPERFRAGLLNVVRQAVDLVEPALV